jgi:hypothetical protein
MLRKRVEQKALNRLLDFVQNDGAMKRLHETGEGSPTEGAGVWRVRVCEEWELERYKDFMVTIIYK